MLAPDPSIRLHVDEDGTLLILEYRAEPRSLLYAAIACRQTIAIAASSPRQVSAFISIGLLEVGRRFWRIWLDETDTLNVSREDLPAALRRMERASAVSVRQPEPLQ